MTASLRPSRGRRSPVFYLEIPPSLFGRMVEGLAGAGLTKEARVAIEKPFGHDLASARALNAELHKFLEERQLYRIDHFLGKEPTMDIVFLRFSNSIFEPLWNRGHTLGWHGSCERNAPVAGRWPVFAAVAVIVVVSRYLKSGQRA